MDERDFGRLERRIGTEHLRRRLEIQVKRAVKLYTVGGFSLFLPTNAKRIHALLKLFFQACGIFSRGRMNCLDYRLERVQVSLANLPPAFHGFRILQLSDLHADGIPDAGLMLRDILSRIECDLCVFTGDYRFDTHSEYLAAMTATRHIVSSVHSAHGLLGVLGNHDFIEFVPDLEEAGLHMLLNESIRIEKNGASILVAGVDDAHMYRCHDLQKAFQERKDKEPAILLSHTPEIYARAERAGVDYLLCGHTHGGQVCLPWRTAIISNADCSRRYCKGSWRYKRLQGYTSRGTGSSGLAVRYCCPPEITLHVLG